MAADRRNRYDKARSLLTLERYLCDHVGVRVEPDPEDQIPTGDCPFCAKPRGLRLLIFPAGEQAFRCSGCERGGSLLRAVMEWRGFDSAGEAADWICSWAELKAAAARRERLAARPIPASANGLLYGGRRERSPRTG